MRGVVAVIVKIMPISPETNIEELRITSSKIMESHGAKNISFEIKDIAFGLKAIMLKMAWPEEKSTDIIENTLQDIPNVSSATIEDYRRAFG